MGMNKANEEQIGQAISDLVAEREPSDKNKEAVQKVVKTVGLIGRQVLAGARVNASLFGSRKYGLATQTSDVDILLSVRVPSEDAEINHAKFFNRFAKRLRKTPGFHVLATITHARVPIVKFEFRSRADGCIQGDISLNASMGMSKTSMLESYISMDKRVKDVMSVVRAWSTARNITSSTSLNSYSLSLMVLAFLVSRRVVPPLQLTRTRQFTRTGWQRLEEIQRNPDEIRNLYDYTISGGKGAELSCIQTNEPLPDWRVDGTRAYFLGTGHGETWESPNKHSSTTLLYEFFRYYGFDFDPMQHVVSLRLGSPEIPRMSLYELQAPEPAMYMTLPTQWRQDLRLLAIEDPFEVEHNCARQVPGEWVEGFLWEMRRAAWSLLPGKSVGLQRLLANPTTDAFRDASVWASAYHRLFPVIQDLLGEQVFSKSELAVPGKVVDLEELEKIDE
ncbi:hypothetical protein FBU59_004065 [Linderina macrospora]|uniref:Uncharacterized protein n=1 Tax=Linderina macrospora TaxID=4868 RepID=A0ACC1J6Q5_9FUNG|nr:hypothetical protein FBU59_004065 [Linderina macrospora]